MKTILVINNNSAVSDHAAEFALYIAQKMQANILLANCCEKYNNVFETVLEDGFYERAESIFAAIAPNLLHPEYIAAEFRPQIEEIDCSEMDENKLADFINKNNIWLLVKGIDYD